MKNELVKYDELQALMQDSGFDYDAELLRIETPNGLDLPRIRIEHRDNGRHQMFIDYGESYSDLEQQEKDVEGSVISGIVFAEQHIRALWETESPVPRCSGIDHLPVVANPVANTCHSCRESVIGTGKCKPKIRLWLLVNGKPLIFNLSPTSIKHWEAHKRKLKRSKLPVVVVSTRFGLEDVKKNGYRWAEVTIDVTGVAGKDELLLAREARDELDRIMRRITRDDFADNGDQLEDEDNTNEVEF